MWHNREALSFRHIAEEHTREEVKKEGGKHPIFSEMEQVLLVQTVNIVTKVLGVDVIIGKEWLSVVVEDAVHGEASWKTRDASKGRLEGLLHVVVIVVLKHLHHSHPRMPLVVDLGLST
jgi:hypothetical protein